MATISKFYFHDDATTNTGTMPGAGDAFFDAVTPATGDATGDATGARTARSVDDLTGSLQTSVTFTATANQLLQHWGMRRWVSAPLAAQTFTAGDRWTLGGAIAESNLNHNQSLTLAVYCWRPSSGTRVGTGYVLRGLGPPSAAATEQWQSGTNTWTNTTSILDGDILVFELSDNFIQSMSTAYTSTFYYDGTTEASATSAASFITPPAPLTLFTGAAAEVIPDLVVAPLR